MLCPFCVVGFRENRHPFDYYLFIIFPVSTSVLRCVVVTLIKLRIHVFPFVCKFCTCQNLGIHKVFNLLFLRCLVSHCDVYVILIPKKKKKLSVIQYYSKIKLNIIIIKYVIKELLISQ